MKIYRISRAKLDASRPSLMTRMATTLTITIAAAVFISFRALGHDADLRLVLLVGLWLGGLFTYAVFKASRKAQAQLDEIAETYELVLDSTSLTRHRRSLVDLTIQYSAIRQIEEKGTKGLNIKGDSALRTIGVPSTVENYEQLKADLVLLTGLDIQRKSSPTVWMYGALILVLGLAATSLLAPNRLLASSASFACAAIVAASVVLVRRNPNVPKELKGRLFLSLLPVFFFLMRGILLLRP